MSDNEQDFFATWEPGDHNLLEEVQRSYRPYAHANRESLWRVQERLEARLQQAQQKKRTSSIKELPIQRKRKTIMDVSSKKAGWSRLTRVLSSIAAVLIVAALVGGALLLFGPKHQSAMVGSKAPIPTAIATHIPDPGPSEVGPGASIITSATTTSHIDPNSHIALDKHQVFARGTVFYVIYNISTKENAGKIAVKVFTNGIQDKAQETAIEANQNKHGYISLSYSVVLSGKIELYWNDQLAYRLYFAVR
ncbi:hypothetical protein KSC_089510 [Ktedonobacter sp. SOSP1-52]|uniref:hypothetical protein n=1 Tax=Ktedonobacter sp. SOSP1-52 TaxID=2778366 RepID=UPI001915EBA3|nr:hypothetical protein [Ktedonobacter sp. SOSP1-52]GHO70059.1 hypothetical protein KSC_089510 [Ktedonobacter sp. SOSP1-52]